MYNQETELSLLEGILPHIERSFIDVGAEKGTFASWLSVRGFSGVACEPLPQHAATLRALETNGSIKFLPFAIDAEDGERDFHIATDANGQPLDYFHSLQPLHGDTRVQHTSSIKVTCRSLSSLTAKGLVPPSPGLLIIDTEGHDLTVLKGLGDMRPSVIMTEFFTKGVYQGWEDAHPDRLTAYANLLGYTHFIAVRRNLQGLERVEYCPLAIAPGEWGNLIFLKASVFDKARSALEENILQNQIEQNSRWNALMRTCEERLTLINTIQAEAEKRLAIINQLTGK